MLTIPMFAIRHREIGGTESAVYNLIRGLHSISQPLRLVGSNPKYLAPDFTSWLASSGLALESHNIISVNRKSRFIEEAAFSLLDFESGPILYPNYFAPPTIMKRERYVMLHDIQYKSLPQFHSSRRTTWLDWYLPRMFLAAEKVFVISQSELVLVERYFGPRAAAKCVVVYNAIDWGRYENLQEDDRTNLLSSRYILCVAHPFPHKNLATLFKSFSILALADPSLQLVMVGVRSAQTIELMNANVPENQRDRIRFTGFVSDRELGSIYRNASLLAVPSLYEGFGMPAAEALGLGTEVVASDLPVLREVTMNYARFVADPTNAQSWADAMSEIIKNGRRMSTEVSSRIRSKYDPRSVALTVSKALLK